MGKQKRGELGVGWPLLLYGRICSAVSIIVLILYIVLIRTQYVIRRSEISVPTYFAFVYNFVFVDALASAGNPIPYIRRHNHKLQQFFIPIYIIFGLLWTGYFVFMLARFPISSRLTTEYTVIVFAIIHSLIVSSEAYRCIRQHRKFIMEAQFANPGISHADADTLYELILLRRLYTKPIRVRFKFCSNGDDGQLQGFHWDDFYHLHRWMKELSMGMSEAVMKELEDRLGIYDTAGGRKGSTIPPDIQKLGGSRRQIREKLIALHKSDHNHMYSWSQWLHSVPSMIPTIEGRVGASQSLIDQMLRYSVLYDIPEEVKFRLLNLSKFGRQLKVPMDETLEDTVPESEDDCSEEVTCLECCQIFCLFAYVGLRCLQCLFLCLQCLAAING